MIRSNPEPKRSEPKGSTRERLLDHGLTLFANKGYVATGTQEIIAAAGVSKPVLYHHFANKRALFLEIVGKIYDESERQWRTVISSDTTASRKLYQVSGLSFQGCAADTRIPRLMMQTHYGPPVEELADFMEERSSRRFLMICEIISQGLESGELRSGDSSTLALLFCCIMDQHLAILSRLPDAKSMLTAERSRALVDAFLHGCGTNGRPHFQIPPISFGKSCSHRKPKENASSKPRRKVQSRQ